MAKFDAGKIWHKFLNTMAKFGTKFLDCGQEKIVTLGIEPKSFHLMMQCLTSSPTSTTCINCIK